MKGYTPFLGMFAEALTPAVPAYYAIAAEGSLTSAEQFQFHCHQLDLSCKPVPVYETGLIPGAVEACFEAEESYYDPDLLRRFAWQRLEQFGVKVQLEWRHTKQIALNHDVVVVTAHAALNEVLFDLGCQTYRLQYELCEVPIVSAPSLAGLSLVVMDGPFCSIAPFRDGRHILYDVEHSVHRREVATAHPDWPPGGASKAGLMLEKARRFVDMGEISYLGSLWGERVVLPYVEHSDARPSTTWWAASNVLAVLSGKVTASVSTGRAIARRVAVRLGVEAPDPALATAPPE
jgi:hypothetical protein